MLVMSLETWDRLKRLKLPNCQVRGIFDSRKFILNFVLIEINWIPHASEWFLGQIGSPMSERFWQATWPLLCGILTMWVLDPYYVCGHTSATPPQQQFLSWDHRGWPPVTGGLGLRRFPEYGTLYFKTMTEGFPGMQDFWCPNQESSKQTMRNSFT